MTGLEIFALCIGIFFGGMLIMLILSTIHRKVMYIDVVQRATRTVCGESYETFLGTNYAIHKKNGNLIEYHFDSQGGCWTGIESQAHDILKKNIVFEDGRYILTKRS